VEERAGEGLLGLNSCGRVSEEGGENMGGILGECPDDNLGSFGENLGDGGCVNVSGSIDGNLAERERGKLDLIVNVGEKPKGDGN
jgi:hypothetical protein